MKSTLHALCGHALRLLIIALMFLLGLVPLAHATGPTKAPEPTPAYAPDEGAKPVVTVFLAAYRANGPPSGVFVVVALGYPRSAASNLYAYGDGDPVNKWDPTGLAAYFFDGTGNHPLAANLDGSANFKTNVRYLFDAYVGDAFYAYGIGTGYDPAGGAYSKGTLSEGVGVERQDSELATGGTMHERVNWMIQRLEGQLAKGDKNVEVFGFSRGSASAVEFLNRIQDKVSEGDPKYQGINVRFVGLFDGGSDKGQCAGINRPGEGDARAPR